MRISKDNKLIPILESLPGFGKILSALVALEIDDISRFPTRAKFASYSGLIPSTFASGGRVYHGDLVPTGSPWLKYAFVEAAWTYDPLINLLPGSPSIESNTIKVVMLLS